MTVKEHVLSLLLYANGAFLSGEQIAASLNVTRAAVWKSIKQLKKDGFSIGAVPSKGYALTQSGDIVTEAGVRKYLRDDSFYSFELLDSVPSTNGLMRQRTANSEGYTVVAKEQTQGVGRRGRRFFSPSDTGLYFSLLLKPNLEASKTILITTMAATAVCRAIEEVSDKKPRIKWVNDVYADGRKVCGILTQGSFSMENNNTEYVILGIGINVYAPDNGFPQEIADTAGFLFARRADDIKNKLLAGILNHILAMYRDMNPATISERYKQYSFVTGRRVLVHRADGSVPATALDINENCALLVQYADGTAETLSSGEISITV